jgi:hypothetical protein
MRDVIEGEPSPIIHAVPCLLFEVNYTWLVGYSMGLYLIANGAGDGYGNVPKIPAGR